MLPDYRGVISLDSAPGCSINWLLVLWWAWFCSACAAAEASKQVEHKWHSVHTSESWRTLVFLKAVIHFVGTDDDGREKGERKRGGGGSHLLVERAIKWSEVVLHVLTNEAEEAVKGRGVLSFLLTKTVMLEQAFSGTWKVFKRM